jgi:hypothetical protein
VERQLEAILGSPPSARLVDLVHERSEGNAFLVEEILGAGRAAPTPTTCRCRCATSCWRASSGSRPPPSGCCGSRRPQARRCLTAARRGRGLADDELDDALREGLEHHVLVADGTGYVFRHALTRDAVYGDTLARERSRIHGSYGAALSADPALAGPDVSVPALLALHWSAAHDLPRRARASVKAARIAAP